MRKPVIEHFACLFYTLKFKLLFVLVLLTGHNVIAQSSFHRISQLEVGYLAGGSGDTYFFVFNHGFGATISHGLSWKSFAVMGGSGIYTFERSSLFPLYIEPSTFLGKKKRGHLRVRTGYAFAKSEGPVDAREYRLKGGWMIAPAYGLQMIRREKSRLIAWIGYYYQNTALEFRPFTGGNKVRSPQHNHLTYIKLSWTFSH